MKYIIFSILLNFLIILSALSETIDKIEIIGNKRISDKTIILFSDIKIKDKYSNFKVNKILKNLYSTDFFEDIKLSYSENKLIITVIENPIVQNIEIQGVKNKSILKNLNKNLKLKEKNSYVEIKVRNDEKLLKNILKSNGYYFSEIITTIKKLYCQNFVTNMELIRALIF